MRGKHGAAAAVRHEVQSAQAEIESYKNAVARLTRERNDARHELCCEQQRHRRVERELRARLDLAASPKINALEEIVATRTAERDASRRDLGEQLRKNERAAKRWFDHFRSEHGLRGTAALEAGMDLVYPRSDGQPWRITDEAERLEGLPTNVVQLITARRGER